MSKLDDKDLSKIAAGGGRLSEIEPDESDPPGATPGTKDSSDGGGGIPPEDQPPPDGATQDIE